MSTDEKPQGVTGAMNAKTEGVYRTNMPTPNAINLDIGTVNDKVAFTLTGALNQSPALLAFDVAQAYKIMAALQQAIDTVEAANR